MRRYINYLPFILIVVLLTALHIFNNYIDTEDSLDNFNIIHTFLYHGKVAFPLYGSFNTVINHPPYFYWVLCLIEKTGLNNFWSLVVLHLSLNYLILLLIYTSPFSRPVKFAFTLALLVPFLYNYTLSIRPDYFLILILFTGLLLLEISRLSFNNRWMHYAGVAMLSLASIIHPFAALAFLGIIPYTFIAAVRYRRSKTSLAWPVIIISATITFLIIGAHFIFYLLPNFGSVLDQVSGKQRGFTIDQAIQWHYDVYLQYQFYLPFFVLLVVVLPVWLCSLVICFYLKQFRTMALALLPLSAFVFFFTVRKGLPYVCPEMMFGIFTYALLFKYIWTQKPAITASKILRGAFIGLSVLALAQCAFILFAFKINYCPQFNWKYGDEMHLERACGQEITGANKTMCGRQTPWYISGSTRWHDMENDLHNTYRQKNFSLRSYLAPYAYIVATSNGTQDEQDWANGGTLNWHLAGLTSVRGFYFNSLSRDIVDTYENNIIFYTAPDTNHADKKVTGFYNDNGRHLYRFSTTNTQNADCYFCSFKLNTHKHNTQDYIDNAIGGVCMKLPPGTTPIDEYAVIYGIFTPAQMDSLHLQNNDEIELHDFEPMKRNEISIDSIMQKWKTQNRVTII